MKLMKYKHLSLNNRNDIEKYLGDGFNFTEISRLLGKSNRCISKEVLKRRMRIKKRNPFSNSKEFICPKLIKPPYVCNGCDKKIACRYTRYEYYSKDAESFYKNTLVTSRTGIDMNADEFNSLNKIINEDTNKGHSFYMILNNHKSEISKTPQTLYNYYHNGYLDINGLDLPRIVRYKKRNKKSEVKIRSSKIRIGRTYQDFLKYKEKFFINNGYDASIIQMDTVEGIKGDSESCLLTLLFVSSNFFMIFKMENKSIDSVNKVFDYLKELLGLDLFSTLFQIVLTDNGSEFFDPDYIENNGSYDKSRVFYCDPRASQQKGSLEVTHEYIRRYVPKGISFNTYSQDDIILMTNHINSVPRNKLNGFSAYKIQETLVPKIFFTKLNYKEISSRDIILKSTLLKQKDTTVL